MPNNELVIVVVVVIINSSQKIMLNIGTLASTNISCPRAVGNAAATKYINLYYKYNMVFHYSDLQGISFHMPV